VAPTPPQPAIFASPPPHAASATATFTFAAAGGAVAYECRIDELAAAPCESPAIHADLADGPHTFWVRSVDPTTRISSAETSQSWNVDTLAPDTSITGATGSEVRFASAPATDGDRFECRLDEGAWQACGSPRTIPSLADGDHSFAVRAIDAVGNVDLTPATRGWKVATVAPDTTITAGPSASLHVSTCSRVTWWGASRAPGSRPRRWTPAPSATTAGRRCCRRRTYSPLRAKRLRGQARGARACYSSLK
jgi:hypothetical protein